MLDWHCKQQILICFMLFVPALLLLLPSRAASLDVRLTLSATEVEETTDVVIQCVYDVFNVNRLVVYYYYYNEPIWICDRNLMIDAAGSGYIDRVTHETQQSYYNGYRITLKSVTVKDDGEYRCYVGENLGNEGWSDTVTLTLYGEHLQYV